MVPALKELAFLQEGERSIIGIINFYKCIDRGMGQWGVQSWNGSVFLVASNNSLFRKAES